MILYAQWFWHLRTPTACTNQFERSRLFRCNVLHSVWTTLLHYMPRKKVESVRCSSALAEHATYSHPWCRRRKIRSIQGGYTACSNHQLASSDFLCTASLSWFSTFGLPKIWQPSNRQIYDLWSDESELHRAETAPPTVRISQAQLTFPGELNDTDGHLSMVPF